MATYNKRGGKKFKSKKKGLNNEEIESTTAEVFESLDTGASKTENFVSKYQNLIITSVVLVTISVFFYLAYNTFILEPKKEDAITELNQAQYYFNLALNSEQPEDLFKNAISGGGGKFGFLDIIENYKNTPSSNLAVFSIGMSYLNLKEYDKVIYHLKNFKSDDVLLNSIAKGVLGDAYLQVGDQKNALSSYEEATNSNENNFTTPKYLYKAGLLLMRLGQKKTASKYFKKIKKNFPNSKEAKFIDIQIAKTE
jgi:tetratricopeptide (TPR) repeat protein